MSLATGLFLLATQAEAGGPSIAFETETQQAAGDCRATVRLTANMAKAQVAEGGGTSNGDIRYAEGVLGGNELQVWKDTNGLVVSEMSPDYTISASATSPLPIPQTEPCYRERVAFRAAVDLFLVRAGLNSDAQSASTLPAVEPTGASDSSKAREILGQMAAVVGLSGPCESASKGEIRRIGENELDPWVRADPKYRVLEGGYQVHVRGATDACFNSARNFPMEYSTSHYQANSNCVWGAQFPELGSSDQSQVWVAQCFDSPTVKEQKLGELDATIGIVSSRRP